MAASETTDITAIVESADKLLRQRRYREAIDALAPFEKEGLIHVPFLRTIGFAHLKLENFKHARRYLRAALAIDKNRVRALLAVADVCAAEREDDESRKFLLEARRTAQAAAADPQTLQYWSEVEMKLGVDGDPMKPLSLALQHFPDNERYTPIWLLRVWRASKFDNRCEDVLRAFDEKHPSSDVARALKVCVELKREGITDSTFEQVEKLVSNGLGDVAADIVAEAVLAAGSSEPGAKAELAVKRVELILMLHQLRKRRPNSWLDLSKALLDVEKRKNYAKYSTSPFRSQAQDILIAGCKEFAGNPDLATKLLETILLGRKTDVFYSALPQAYFKSVPNAKIRGLESRALLHDGHVSEALAKLLEGLDEDNKNISCKDLFSRMMLALGQPESAWAVLSEMGNGSGFEQSIGREYIRSCFELALIDAAKEELQQIENANGELPWIARYKSELERYSVAKPQDKKAGLFGALFGTQTRRHNSVSLVVVDIGCSLFLEKTQRAVDGLDPAPSSTAAMPSDAPISSILSNVTDSWVLFLFAGEVPNPNMVSRFVSNVRPHVGMAVSAGTPTVPRTFGESIYSRKPPGAGAVMVKTEYLTYDPSLALNDALAAIAEKVCCQWIPGTLEVIPNGYVKSELETGSRRLCM